MLMCSSYNLLSSETTCKPTCQGKAWTLSLANIVDKPRMVILFNSAIRIVLTCHMWMTFTGCRIGYTLAVISTRLAGFFAKINCIMHYGHERASLVCQFLLRKKRKGHTAVSPWNAIFGIFMCVHIACAYHMYAERTRTTDNYTPIMSCDYNKLLYVWRSRQGCNRRVIFIEYSSKNRHV
jgi:hypothetical protein